MTHPIVTRDYKPWELRLPMEDAIWLMSHVKNSTYAVYSALQSFADWQDHSCYPSVKSIAERANVSQRTAVSAINELVELGVVTKSERYVNDRDGQQSSGRTSNSYTIHRVPASLLNDNVQKTSPPPATMYPPSCNDVPTPPATMYPPSCNDVPTPHATVAHELASLVNERQLNERQLNERHVNDAAEAVSTDVESAAASRSMPRRETKEPSPTTAIMDAYLSATGLERFTNYPQAGAAAKALAKAGFTPDDVRDMVEWAMSDKWLAQNLTLNLLASRADAYRVAIANADKIARASAPSTPMSRSRDAFDQYFIERGMPIPPRNGNPFDIIETTATERRRS